MGDEKVVSFFAKNTGCALGNTQFVFKIIIFNELFNHEKTMAHTNLRSPKELLTLYSSWFPNRQSFQFLYNSFWHWRPNPSFF
jgi:hypothetical protein